MKLQTAITETPDTDNPFYKVEQVRLHLPDGRETPFFGNVRADTGECLKAVTERYTLIQNEELIGRSESLFAQKGLRFTRKAIVTNGGARMYANYEFENIGFKVRKDDFKFRLSVRNSFDGSMKVSLMVGLFRVICSNGASVMEEGIDLMRKHTSSLDLQFASGAIDASIDSFHRQYDAIELMTRQRLTQQEGHFVLNGLVKRKTIADRVADKVREIWDKPSYEEDRDRNLYNLWNASTEHFTHDVAGTRKKFELSQRLSTDVTRTLIAHARSGNLSDLFVKELQKNN